MKASASMAYVWFVTLTARTPFARLMVLTVLPYFAEQAKPDTAIAMLEVSMGRHGNHVTPGISRKLQAACPWSKACL